MSKEIMLEKVTVTVLGKQIVLDPENLRYDETNLGNYMGEEFGWVDYFGKQLEYAQKELLFADIDAEAIYSKKFLESKDAGNSDNYAKAVSLSDPEVIAAKKHVADRKETVGHLKSHLRAWDKNHENVQNRSNTLRKELDKLHPYNYSSFKEETCNAEDFLGSLSPGMKND